jgi:hypothetical protein
VDPVPDPLLLRKSGSAGNRTRTSGLAARKSEHSRGIRDNIKMDLRDRVRSVMSWIVTDWRALMKTVVILRTP